jgi:di/tricarboxylate transporter
MDVELTLTREMMIVLGLVGFIIVMLMFQRIRADGAALVVLVVLGLTGLIKSDRLFAGFSSAAVISVIATMILGAGLDRTGVLNRLATLLLRISRGVEERLILLNSLAAGLMSGFMQNPSVTALFLPITSRVSARSGVGLQRLLMPMAVAVITGAGLTMVGNSPLMMLNDLLLAANNNLPAGVATLKPLPMFAPLPIGLILLLAGLIFFRVFGRKLFRQNESSIVTPNTTGSYFAKSYGIEGDLFELTLTAESNLVGLSIGDAEAQADAPLYLALQSGNEEERLAPPADRMLWIGSVLGVMGKRADVEAYAKKHRLHVSTRLRTFDDLFNPANAGISEAIIPPNSHFIGRSAADLKLRKKYGVSLLAINRDASVIRENVRQLKLRAGDMLVFHSVWADLSQAGASRDFVTVTDYPKDEHRPHKLYWAAGIFAASMLLALTTLVPVPIALMSGAAAMMAAGVLNMDEAYAAVNWKTIFLMACLIPLGWAMDSTGAANWIAMKFLGVFGFDIPIWVLELLVALLTCLFGLVIGNVGATVVMVPLSINIALAAGGSPTAFALITALSASNNFLTSSNPVISMVIGPGDYRQKDIWRSGLWLTLIYTVIILLAVNIGMRAL